MAIPAAKTEREMDKFIVSTVTANKTAVVVANSDGTNVGSTTSLTTLLSGEDQTNGVLAVVQKPIAVATYCYDKDVSSALEASSISKATAGTLYKSFGVIDSTAATGTYYIQFLDSATLPANGAVTHIITPIPVSHVNGTNSSFDTGDLRFGVAGVAGIVICLSTTMVTKTISGSTLFATVLFK